ncbi:Phist protein [Plasmodium gonderi]|uniref:Phist protein n=1 Tax=Plasmodium gonderi TaxID=77519 RepID=A0A1Y1JBG8_PLAGO|nr:Phist protein [Plasmodium gonderi]GAW79869.1 Phist protein [Plasmodium gonderi]
MTQHNRKAVISIKGKYVSSNKNRKRKESMIISFNSEEWKCRKIGMCVNFSFLAIFNIVLLTLMVFFVQQEKILNEESLRSIQERCQKYESRQLAELESRRMKNEEGDDDGDDENDEDEEQACCSGGTSSKRRRKYKNIDVSMKEPYRLNNGQAENYGIFKPIDYVKNDTEPRYELPDYDTIKERERKQKEEFNSVPYEVNDHDFLRNVSEDSVNERIERLGENVDVKEMFVIWNYVNGFERIKYINMQKNIIEYCENLTYTYNVPRKKKTEQWIKVYHYMKDHLFYKERSLHKKLYNFLEHGACPKKLFIEFINQTKNSWRNFRRDVNSVCMNMLNSNLT